MSISEQLAKYEINFSSNFQNHETYVAKIIPFDSKGSEYDQGKEFYIQESEYETQLEINIITVVGVIVILTQPSHMGEYNTVEMFTPENAPWELSGQGAVVINKTNNEAMFGRKQFSKVYTYDGSLCVLGKKQLQETSAVNPIPLIFKKSHIVKDWVDYLYFTTE